jgi:hypothetical protein
MSDVGVRQRREHLRFALESRRALRVADEVLRQDLQRDVALKFRSARAIDLPMPPAPSSEITSYAPTRVPLARGIGGADYTRVSTLTLTHGAIECAPDQEAARRAIPFLTQDYSG